MSYMSDEVKGTAFATFEDGQLKSVVLKRNDDSLIEVDVSSLIKKDQESSGSIALNVAPDFINLTLADDVTISSFDDDVVVWQGGTTHLFTLIVKQDTDGAHVLTWPDGVKWAGGVAPVVTADGNAIDVFTFFTTNGGVEWYGFTSGVNMLVAS